MAEISVIVPVYNSEKHLDNCVESILSQSFEDFEIILVDDGSADRSAEICDSYSKQYKNIHVIHQKNGGAGNARNSGINWVIQNSKSKWIHFIDADDTVHPDILKILYENCLHNEKVMAICNYKMTNTHKIVVEKDGYKVEQYTPSAFLLRHSYVCHMPVCKLIPIGFFQNCLFPDGKLYEDVFLMYKLIYKAEKIIFIDSPLYFYFNNPESSMNTVYSIKKLDEVEAGEEQVQFFEEKHDEKNLIQAYRRLMYYYDSHMRNLKTLPDGKPYYKTLKRKLAKLLRQKAKLCSISVKDNSAYYESAFPIFMKFYWRWKKVQSLFHK